jgi:hypothetical protein
MNLEAMPSLGSLDGVQVVFDDDDGRVPGPCATLASPVTWVVPPSRPPSHTSRTDRTLSFRTSAVVRART